MLANRLAEIRSTFENGPTDQSIHQFLEQHIQDLAERNASDQALKVGDRAPLNHRVCTGDATLSLAEMSGPKALILTWFRGTW